MNWGRAGSVLISGARSGIGRACAATFAREGWTVGALDLHDETNVPTTGVVPLVADVANTAQVHEAVSQFVREQTPLNACVNAAGIYPRSTLVTADEESFRNIFDVNVLGTILLTQAAVKHMTRGGSVVNFASINAFFAKPDQLLYSAAKAAVVALTRTLAAELAPDGIRVNAVAPGPVDTEGMRAVPGRLTEIAASIPLGRAATADEIADLVYWLTTGNGAQYITGETIIASGGLVSH